MHERPAYRGAFRRRRCLVPADAWFEWRREESGKQPYCITAAGGAPLSFAALWERWEKGGEPLETFSILTTDAAPALAAIHHRQPSIVEADDFEEWLDPGSRTERLLALARAPYEGPFPGARPGAMMGNVVMTQALRNAGVAASGHGFRSSFNGWARQHDVNELLSEFALAHVEGSATVAAYAATTCSRSADRSCRRGPTASRRRGGFRTGYGPPHDSCGVRRLPTMRRPARPASRVRTRRSLAFTPVAALA